MSTEYFRHEFLRFECVRYVSFGNWSLQLPSREELAQAGFYYGNECFRVHCFSCGITVDMWHVNRSPLDQHLHINPNCPYILGRDPNIISMQASPRPNAYFPIAERPFNPRPSSHHTSLEEPSLSHVPHNLTAGNKKASGMVRFLELPSRTEHTLDSLGFYAMMRKEEERLKTFAKGGWPFEFATPSAMAKNGFFHCLLGSVVQCAFCHVVIIQWTYDTEPDSIHERESPACPMVLRQDCGNVAIPVPEQADYDRNTTCVLCLEAQRAILFKPCNHFVSCSLCAAKQTKCPVCRAPVKGQLKLKLQ